MAKQGQRLENGDRFPRIEADRVDGGSTTVPDEMAGDWAVLLFYRGHW